MKQIPPLRLKQAYFAGIEASIKRAIFETVFAPLMRALQKPDNEELLNAGNALLDALRDGTIWYSDGAFRGKFDAGTTRELRALGAMYNAPSKTWMLPAPLVTADIRMAQAHADMRYDSLRRSFLQTLDNIHVDSINEFVDFSAQYEQAIDWMEGDFEKTLKAITVPPNLTPKTKEILAREWGQNLELYVKNWADENIIKMRGEVQGNTFAGRRATDLVDVLQSNYGIGKRKAEFLARQETSLLLSKYRENRYKDIGARSYRWSTSHDERVRHDHRDLNGKIFSWDAPPVTNRRTGARNNPGEDFNCRCVAIAIID